MPVMDGWTLRRRLLNERDLASIPVVLLTGISAADAFQVERVSDVVTKPFDFQFLLSVVDRHVAATSSTARAG